MRASKTVIAGGFSVLLFGLAQPGLKGHPERTRPIVSPFRHVVVIIDENVSLDHYFATYPQAANPSGDPVFGARPGTPSVNGLTPGLIAGNPNSTKPFGIPRSRQLLCNPSPYYPGEHAAYHSGLLDRFPESTGQTANTNPPCEFGLGTGVVMGYYDGNTVTALWNYAQNFAMSDNYFGTTYGMSAPGHLNLISGETHGAMVVTAANPELGIVDGTIYGTSTAALEDCQGGGGSKVIMTGTNIGDLLGYFQGGFAATSRTPDGTAVCGALHTSSTGMTTADYSPDHQPFQKYMSTSNPHHLPPSSVSMIGFSDQANHQYDLSDLLDSSRRRQPAGCKFSGAARLPGRAPAVIGRPRRTGFLRGHN